MKNVFSCPKCHTTTSVVDSRRTNTTHEQIKRRRHCSNCHHRFNTIEINEELAIAANLSELYNELTSDKP